MPPITKTRQVRRTRHTGHCWRSKDELISDVLLWTPTYGQAKAGRPARTYIQQLCEDTGCNPEDLPEAMNNRERWRERVRDIRAGGTTWWWWWWCIVLHTKSIFSLKLFSSIRTVKHFVTSLTKQVRLLTVVEGDPKAPFSIATTPRRWGGPYSFPRIAPLYPWFLPYNAEC